MEGLGTGLAVVVFYLYLLARWQHVRRPMIYLLGAAVVVVFGLLYAVFAVCGLPSVAMLFHAIGTFVAFAGAVGACYGAQLPMKLPGSLDATGTPPPPPAK